MFEGKVGWEYRVIQNKDNVTVQSVQLKNDEVVKVNDDIIFTAADKGSLINEVNFMINACAKDNLTPDGNVVGQPVVVNEVEKIS